MPMNPEVKAKWLEALRSGEYEQGKGELRRGDTYCCLGVLCNISQLGRWNPYDSGAYSFNVDSNLPAFGMLPKSISVWSELFVDNQNRLGQMNDGGASFPEIADWIEANL